MQIRRINLLLVLISCSFLTLPAMSLKESIELAKKNNIQLQAEADRFQR